MFSSPGRIDIVLDAGPGGVQRYVQTDHRTVEELERAPARSVLFALERVLSPERMVPAGARRLP